jgi:hypothetical protein
MWSSGPVVFRSSGSVSKGIGPPTIHGVVSQKIALLIESAMIFLEIAGRILFLHSIIGRDHFHCSHF